MNFKYSVDMSGQKDFNGNCVVHQSIRINPIILYGFAH